MCSQKIHWVQWGRRNNSIGIKALEKEFSVKAHIAHYKKPNFFAATEVMMYKHVFAYQYFRSLFMGDSLDLGSQRAIKVFHSHVAKSIMPEHIVYTIANGSNVLSSTKAKFKIHEQVSCTLELAALRNRIQGTSYDLEAIHKREKAIFDSSDIIVCPSDCVYDYVKNFNCHARPLKILYPVPDLHQYSLKSPNNTLSKISFAFAGRIEASKGVATIFELARLFPNIDFHMFGAVMCEVPNLDNIKLHGKLPQNQLFEKMVLCSAFLFPSFSEGSSFVTLEALGLGMPGIVSFQAGSHYLHGETGIVIDANDLDAWKDEVNTIVNDPDILLCYRERIKSLSSYGLLEYESEMQRLLYNVIN